MQLTWRLCLRSISQIRSIRIDNMTLVDRPETPTFMPSCPRLNWPLSVSYRVRSEWTVERQT